jgi:hypothetical protein
MEELLLKTEFGVYFIFFSVLVSAGTGIVGGVITYKNYKKRETESSQENKNCKEILKIKEKMIDYDNILKTITNQYQEINTNLKDFTKNYREDQRSAQLEILKIYELMQKWGRNE